jgi:hypothetical protein
MHGDEVMPVRPHIYLISQSTLGFSLNLVLVVYDESSQLDFVFVHISVINRSLHDHQFKFYTIYRK